MEESVKIESCDPHMIIKSIEESIETLRSIETFEQLKKEEQLSDLEEQNQFGEDENESSVINSPLAYVFTCYHCGSNYATKGDIRLHLKDGYCSGVRCDFCWRYFPSRKSVQCHIVNKCLKLVSPVSDNFPNVSATKFVRCSKCNQSFLTKDIKKHRSLHQQKSECGVCHRVFKSKVSFKRHQMIHSGIHLFECDYCKEKFRLLPEMREHEKKHNMQNHVSKHSCDICGKQVHTTSNLRSHMIVHSDVRPFSCDLCSSAFKSKSVLSKHISTIHKRERNFACGICGKVFAQSGTLKGHLIIHTAEKPFECEICQKHFRCRRSLKEHILIHQPLTDRLLFKCDKCCKYFKTKSYLKVHHSFHSDLRPFPCAACGKSFKTKRVRDGHVATVHSSERRILQCETCGLKVKTERILNRHVAVHSELKPFE